MPKLKKKSHQMKTNEDKFRKRDNSDTTNHTLHSGPLQPQHSVKPSDNSDTTNHTLHSGPLQPQHSVKPSDNSDTTNHTLHSGPLQSQHSVKPSANSDTTNHTLHSGPIQPQHSVNPGALVPHDYIFHGLNPDTVLRGSIEITVMDYFSALLKAQFGQIHGLIPPSVLYQQELMNEQPYEGQLVPEGSDAVQIHFINDHYIVSSKSNKIITIYDSLRNPERIRMISQQLNLVYRDIGKMNLNYVVPQNQGATVDCGAFAAANAYFLLKGKSLCQLTLNQCTLRPHLRLCLQTQTITDFPHRNYISGSTYLDNYLEAQANRQRSSQIYSNRDTEQKYKREQDRIVKKRLLPFHEEKLTENEKDNSYRQQHCMNPETKLSRREREAMAKRIKREDPQERRRRNEKERESQRKKREDSEVRRKRNERETPAQRKKGKILTCEEKKMRGKHQLRERKGKILNCEEKQMRGKHRLRD